MKEERRNAGWDGEDGGMSRQTALQVVVVVIIIVIIIIIIIDLLSLWRTEAPVGLGRGCKWTQKGEIKPVISLLDVRFLSSFLLLFLSNADRFILLFPAVRLR